MKRYSTDLRDYANQWTQKETDGVKYWQLEVVYCAKPQIIGGVPVQQLRISAPYIYMKRGADGMVLPDASGVITSASGVAYTSATAPIIYHNTSGGYSASSIQDVNIGYLEQGYVHVSVATRGKGTVDDDGKYIGQFPVLIVDLKAGIRFMKANSAYMPGNTESIAMRGHSSGGAVTTMLGASGNAPVFDPYFDAIGAAKATDDILIALCSAPITNLSCADAAYEWFHRANKEYYLFKSMSVDKEGNKILENVGPDTFYTLGSNKLGGRHEGKLSALLYDWFTNYVRRLGFDLGDDGRSGTFYTGLAEVYSRALTEYVRRYEQLPAARQQSGVTTGAGYIDYLVENKNGNEWFDWDKNTKTATVKSFDSMVYNFINRGKMCPSLDSYNYRSNENDAFVAPDGTRRHFDPVVRDMLKALIDKAGEYGWTAEELTYIESLYADYKNDVTEESAAMLEVMSPINYIIDKNSGACIAPWWRFRIGSNDGDHGFAAAWLTAHGLWKHTNAQVDIGVSWNMPHIDAQLIEQDLYDYIDGIITNV